MSAHTPGPWRATQMSDGTMVLHADIAHSSCRTLVAKVAPFADFLSVEERADAHLIAAAPDLLAALRPFAEEHTPAMDSYPCHVGICPPERCGRCGRALEAAAAIAKAEGRS